MEINKDPQIVNEISRLFILKEAVPK